VKKQRHYYLFSILFAAPLVCPPPAVAQSLQTYVTSGGLDILSCAITIPCATFGYALSQTAPGGEIDALSDGNFFSGTFPYAVINQSVTIDGGGHHVTITNFGSCTPPANAQPPVAAVPVNGQAAICIMAGAEDSVTLRNLTLNLQVPRNSSFVGYGILVGKAGYVRIENVTIDGTYVNGFENPPGGAVPPHLNYGVFTQFGVTSLQNVRIQNATLGSGGAAVLATSSASVSISNSSLTASYYGVVAQYGAQADVDNCVLSGNFTALSTSGGAAVVSGFANPGGTIRMSGNTITNNTLGLQTTGAGASLISFGNNAVFGNQTNGSPNGTEALK
jgi:hypothetical protein